MISISQANVSRRPGELNHDAVAEISACLRQLLADVFCLYMKTKNFHWHMTGRHFRDFHLLLDEQADQVFSMTDEIAERARKIGGRTLHSIGEITSHQRLADNDCESVSAENMLLELRDDNAHLAQYLRAAHEISGKNHDVATTSLIETWIDQTERRIWFLSEIVDPDAKR
jgi:starvation-inducible DNA-binding protein